MTHTYDLGVDQRGHELVKIMKLMSRKKLVSTSSG